MVRDRVSAEGAHGCVVTSLDEVMWLFNVRGNPADVSFNPVILSYAVVTCGDSHHEPTAAIWVDLAKVKL